MLTPFSVARKVNRLLRERQRAAARRYLHPVRRVERVFPPPGQRVVAMTFDDGPCAGPARPGGGRGLTETLLAALAAYDARGTFDVIGTTTANYPDREGKLGTAQWSGIAHDHYPEFGRDELAGAVNQPDLIKALIDGGHELANHGYHHVAFGQSRFVYGRRSHLPNLDAVIADLQELHDYLEREFGYTVRLARPPHYIDNIAGGHSAYDAYAALGYLYLAASCDGGGWQPSSGDYSRDVENMVTPLARALQENPAALNGQIIFQKDGYNMSKQSPVCDALPRQLELLRRHGYRVVTVSELLALSPFIDLDPSHPAAAGIMRLERAGLTLGFRDNSFQPNRTPTRGELAMTLARPGDEAAGAADLVDVPASHPYAAAIRRAVGLGLMAGEGGRFFPDRLLSWPEVRDIALTLRRRYGPDLPAPATPANDEPVTRLAVLAMLDPYLPALAAQ